MVAAGVAVCDIGAFEVDRLKFITLGFALNTTTVHPDTPLQGTVTVTNLGDKDRKSTRLNSSH